MRNLLESQSMTSNMSRLGRLCLLLPWLACAPTALIGCDAHLGALCDLPVVHCGADIEAFPLQYHAASTHNARIEYVRWGIKDAYS